jgi:hypothetical protein
VGGTFTSNRYLAKGLEVKDILLRNQRGPAILALAADVENGNLPKAVDSIQNFLRHIALRQALEEKKSG